MKTQLLATLLPLAVSIGGVPNGSPKTVGARASTPAVVTVVLKDGFARADLAAVVRRTPGPNSRNIIALKRSTATPELLATALAILGQSRATVGETPSRTITVVIRDGLKLRPLSASERTRVETLIVRLLSTGPQLVPGVGRVPAIKVDLAH